MPSAQTALMPLRRRLNAFIARCHAPIGSLCDPYRPGFATCAGPVHVARQACPRYREQRVAREAASSSSSQKSPAQGRAFPSLALVLTVASATARSASTARCGVDVRRTAALRHRRRCCAWGGRGRHLRACVHRRATAAARRIGLCHVGRGTLDPRRNRTPFVMTAGHDRRRLCAGAGHRLLAHGRSAFSRVIRAFSRVMRGCTAARSRPSRALRVAMSFSRVTRSVTPARVRSVTPARVRSSTRARDLSSTLTRALGLGERSVARCRCAADPGRRTVDRQSRRQTLMRLPVAAPVGAA